MSYLGANVIEVPEFDLDMANDAAYQPIGVSCRICERADCHQRAVPPLEAALRIDHDRRDTLPYRLDDPRAGLRRRA